MALFATYRGSGTPAVKDHFTTPRRQHLQAARRTERPGEGLLVGPAGRCRLGKPDDAKTLLLTANTETVYACVI
jgi:hypothetical protein